MGGPDVDEFERGGDKSITSWRGRVAWESDILEGAPHPRGKEPTSVMASSKEGFAIERMRSAVIEEFPLKGVSRGRDGGWMSRLAPIMVSSKAPRRDE